MPFKKKLTIIIGAFFLINLAVFIFLILPSFSKMQSGLDSYSEGKLALATVEKEISNFKDFDTKASFYLSDLARMHDLIMEQVFVDRELPINFIDFLEKEAQETGISLKIAPAVQKTKSDSDFFKSAQFQLNVEGQFSGILHLLQKIENWQWLAEIENISITKYEKEAKVGAIVLIKIYVRD